MASFPWLGCACRTPPPHPRAHQCAAPHVQGVSTAGGATRWHQPRVPTGLPLLLAEQIALTLPTTQHPTSPAASVLAPQRPKSPGIGWRRGTGILAAPAAQLESSDLGISLGCGRCRSRPRSQPAGHVRRKYSVTIPLRARTRVWPSPLFTAHFWGWGGEGGSAGVTAGLGWVAAVNMLPSAEPAPWPVNHSWSWNKVRPGQPVPSAAPQQVAGTGDPPAAPVGSPSRDPSHPWHRSCPPKAFRDSPIPTDSPVPYTCPELASALLGARCRAEPTGNVPEKTN